MSQRTPAQQFIHHIKTAPQKTVPNKSLKMRIGTSNDSPLVKLQPLAREVGQVKEPKQPLINKKEFKHPKPPDDSRFGTLNISETIMM